VLTNLFCTVFFWDTVYCRPTVNTTVNIANSTAFAVNTVFHDDDGSRRRRATWTATMRRRGGYRSSKYCGGPARSLPERVYSLSRPGDAGDDCHGFVGRPTVSGRRRPSSLAGDDVCRTTRLSRRWLINMFPVTSVTSRAVDPIAHHGGGGGGGAAGVLGARKSRQLITWPKPREPTPSPSLPPRRPVPARRWPGRPPTSTSCWRRYERDG